MKYFLSISTLGQIFILTGLLPNCIHSENILVWGAVGSHSIRLSMTPFMEALAEKGHNVTFITVFEDFEKKNSKSKINTFVPKKWQEAMGSWEAGGSFSNVRKVPFGLPRIWYEIRPLGILACETMYSDPEFLEFVKNSPKYDLVVVEMLLNECAYGLAHMWGSKVVMYSTTSVIPSFYDAHGLPDESSSISDIFFGYPAGNEMAFHQRIISALNPIIFGLTKEYFYYPKLEEVTRKAWKELGMKEEDVPSFKEVEKNVSLVLLTTHFSLEYARSLPPNVIQIGGAVVTQKQKPLSEEVKTFVNSAKNGFIYISFGTMVEFSNFDVPIQVEFIEALKHFPKTKFLWKSSLPINFTLPENILVTSWIPQQTVLAHKNIIGFVSHCGMGGVTEAIQFSVPLICIPVVAEQDHNAQAMVTKGVALKLEVIGLKRAELKHAISEFLTNKRYKNAMTKLTEIFKDRPMPPLENAIYWVEYILRHDNVNEFLRSPSTLQPWYKRRQIDIWLTLAFMFLAVFLLMLHLTYVFFKNILYFMNKQCLKPQKTKLS